jgi:hypothetical protein
MLLSNGTPDEVRAMCKKIIDEVAQDGGYIMDASALIMNDAKVENVQAMIDFTLDYGIYSQRSSTSSIDEVLAVSKPKPAPIEYAAQKRPAGVCIPWEQKKTELPEFIGDEALAKSTWESVDGMGYGFLWVNLTW